MAQKQVSGILRGALIACEDGDVAIEAVKIGDIVNTLSDGPQVVRWVGSTRLTSPMVRFQAGALGENTPTQDLWVMPAQRMVISGWRAEVLFGEARVLVQAEDLLNGGSIGLSGGNRETEVFYILFDKHEIIKANGALSESFYPSRLALKALSPKTYAELAERVPELGTLAPNRPFALVCPAISAAEAALLR